MISSHDSFVECTYGKTGTPIRVVAQVKNQIGACQLFGHNEFINSLIDVEVFLQKNNAVF